MLVRLLPATRLPQVKHSTTESLRSLVWPLALCIRETPKQVLLQTVNTQMKDRIMRHFTRVYTIC